MTDIDLDMFTADYPEFAAKLNEALQENETLRAENKAFRVGSQEKPKSETGTEWQPPNHEEIESELDALDPATLGEQGYLAAVREIERKAEPPAAEPEPVEEKSPADVEREANEIFRSAESETELLQRLADAGALDQPLTHVR